MSEYEAHEKYAVMARVLDARYTDLKEEKSLCDQLLLWAEEKNDLYGRAFACTYIGDYFTAHNESKKALSHLLKAKLVLEENSDWKELRIKNYIFLAICYETQAEEQNSIQYYMDALALAREINDTTSEVIILNNLAYALQRHHSYEEAYTYFEKACRLQEGPEKSPIRATILSNLADLSMILGDEKKARYYLELGEQEGIFSEQDALLNVSGWCCYYIRRGETENAFVYAEKILNNKDRFNTYKLSAFEKYNLLCQSMIDIKNRGYAQRFLEAMEELGEEGGLDRLQLLEKKKMNYCLAFGTEEEKDKAYEEYFHKSQEFKNKVNLNVANAMQSKIHLYQLTRQKEALQSKQDSLIQEANIDGLTAISNRQYLNQLMKKYSSGEAGILLGIIMIDVDYFKEYNDFYGHMKGDEVLKRVSSCLSENQREGIFPCRYGGDEFTCLCVDLSEEEIREYIGAVQNRLSSEFIPHEVSYCDKKVTLSIGYSTGKRGQEELSTILYRADQALYDSKRKGRNTFSKR